MHKQSFFRLIFLVLLSIVALLILIISLNMFPLSKKTQKIPQVTNTHATVTNSNLSINHINMAELLRCKWWTQNPDESEEDAIRRSSFNTTDCSNYFPTYFAKRFFIYTKSIDKIIGSGVVVRKQGSNEYIVPSVVEASSIQVFNTLSRIQQNLLSEEKNTPLSLFQKISSLHDRIIVVYELPEATKISSIIMGAVKKQGNIEIVDNIRIEAKTNTDFQVYMGYVRANDNVERITNHVDSTSNLTNTRYLKLVDRTYNSAGDSLSSTFSFLDQLSQFDWNQRVFPSNLVSTTSCIEHITTDLGLNAFEKVSEFCDYLKKVYSSNAFYQSDNFIFNINDTTQFLGEFINPYIDGMQSLVSLPWDLIYFPHKKATYKTFNFAAVGNLFLQKLIQKYTDIDRTYKIETLVLDNLNLTKNIIQTFFYPLFEKNQLNSLTFKNNQVPYSVLEHMINQPNLKKLILEQNLIKGEILDLNSLTLLEELRIKGNIFPRIKLNSSVLNSLEINKVGLRILEGLDKSRSMELISLDNNNLNQVNLASDANIVHLSAENNNIEAFNIESTQRIEELNLTSNKITDFTHTNGNFLKKLYLSNNNLTNLSLASSNLKTLYVNKNSNLNNFSINTASLEELNLSEVQNAQSLLDTHFVAQKLKYLNLSDSKINDFKNSWIGTNVNKLKLILANVNNKSEDDNEITELNLTSLVNLEFFAASNIGLQSITIANDLFKYLDISNNPLTQIAYTNAILEEINLSGNSVSNDAVELLIHSQDSLKTLNISRTNSTWENAFSQVHFSNLQILIASENNYLETPTYFSFYKNQLTFFDLSHNNLRNRFDAFGYLQLQKLDLKGNQDILAIINLDHAPVLKELRLAEIPRVVDRITNGSSSLEALDISNTETQIIKPVRDLFPNVLSLDISGNQIKDLYELVHSKTTSIASSLISSSEIIRNLPKINNIYFFGSDFDMLNFIKSFVIGKNAYRLHIDPSRIVLNGDMDHLKRWFNEIFNKWVFLVDRDKNTVLLKEIIVKRFFIDFKKKYNLQQDIPAEHLNNFQKINPVLTVDDLTSTKKTVNLYLKSLYSDIVNQYESKELVYKNTDSFKAGSVNNVLHSFRIIMYSLFTSVVVLAILIVMIFGWLLYRKKK